MRSIWQDVSGCWLWGGERLVDPQVNTCFAMLFLAKGRAPIVISKLKYNDDTTNTEGKWNQRSSRDAANITHWIGRLLEGELAFQIVTLDAPLEDMIESPILYVAGGDALKLSEAAQAETQSIYRSGGHGGRQCGLR